jgi:hypothetical protein
MANQHNNNSNESNSNNRSMALAIVPPKPLAIVLPKPLATMPSKEIILASSGTQQKHPPQQSFYTHEVSTFRLEPPPLHHTITDRSHQFNVLKELIFFLPSSMRH